MSSSNAKPEFSIIIPTYNEGKILDQTLDYLQKSLQGISYEIIISDGDSRDDTLAIAQKYKVKTVVAKGGNKSIAEARNLGAGSTCGAWLLFQDADIRIVNIAHFLTIARDHCQNPKISGITMRVVFEPDKKRWYDAIFMEIINICVWMINASGKGAALGEVQFMPRRYFDLAKGYNERLVTSEDADMFRRLNKLGKTLFLPQFQAIASRRRVEKEGWLRMIRRFIINFLWYAIFKHSYIKKWPVVR